IEMAVPFHSKKLAISWRAKPPKIVGLAGAMVDSLPRLSGSSLDEGQDIRNLHLPEVAAAPSNFVLDLPRIADFERLKNSGGSWLLREKRKRKRAERRAAEFKELRENGVNKIFPLVHVKARSHKHAQSKEGNLADRRRNEDNEDEILGWDPGEKERGDVARPIEGVWDRETDAGKRRRRGREAEVQRRRGRKGAGIERERERKSERATSPVKGKDEDRRKSQWPAKVCCPFVTRERVGRRNCVVGFSTENPRDLRTVLGRPVPLPYSTRTASRRIVSATLYSREHRELNAISVYPTTRHASSIADSGDANAIKRLASRFSLAIATE
ncbi:hypothetical protein ALC57_14340, partial [Trachymyrmex cornetzi]